ncbi:MAG: TIGR01212 family radical SAM protein, partial [Lachnospiraceae bacterium]
SYTNTYAPVPYLRQLFEEAMAHPDIVALSVGTRPDCLPGEVLDLLEELNLKKPVWVELGLQTIHEETAGLIRRGYEFPCFFQAVRELKKRGLTVVVHVILGLPGETREMMLDTVRTLADLDIHGIKLQLLHVLKGTDLEKLYETQGFPILSLEEYLDLVIDCVALLPPRLVVHRISGDGPKSLLVAPLWSGNKRMVLNAMTRRFRERGVTQGDAYEALEEKNHKKTLED